jgi:hypothetical protein
MARVVAALFAALILAGPVVAANDVEMRPSGPITITAGGTYTGNWVSTTSTPAITIATTEPVRISGTVKNLAGGNLIETWPIAVQVTVDHVFAYGGSSYQTSGRFFQAEDFKSVVIRNCTIENTLGIELNKGVAGGSVLVTRNKHHNIQGNGTDPVGNFVQFRALQNSSIEVSWNQIINEFGKSEPEDVISIYKSAHTRVHDNYLQGGYPLTNTTQSSANGITVEVGEGDPPASFDNEIWNNTVVDNVGGIAIVGGYDNSAHDNRIVQDGKLPDGSTLLAANLGLAVWNIGGFSGFADNHARHNVVGFVNATHHRNDMWFPDAPGDYIFNTRMRGRVTRATERAEWTAWRAKLAAKWIRVGA